MRKRLAVLGRATARWKLVLFEDPLVCGNTLSSDFRGEDLIARDRRLPGRRQITRQLTRELRPGRRPVLLMLDFMHRGIGFFRGYQVGVFVAIQSVEQLFQTYGQHQSIGANCGVQIAYGANDVATPKLLSEMTGRRTVEYRRESRDGGLLGGRRSESETEAGRPLLSPDEVRRLLEGEALISPGARRSGGAGAVRERPEAGAAGGVYTTAGGVGADGAMTRSGAYFRNLSRIQVNAAPRL